MRTRTINSEGWPTFFDDFTRLYRGRRVNIETLGDGTIGVTSRAADMPLVGIVAAHPTVEAVEAIIEIFAGDELESTMISIQNPKQVVIAHEDDGRAVALQIESTDGSVTMIRFDASMESLASGFMVEL